MISDTYGQETESPSFMPIAVVTDTDVHEWRGADTSEGAHMLSSDHPCSIQIADLT